MNALLKASAVALAVGALAATAVSRAEGPRAPAPRSVLVAAPPGTVVFDDDGGRVQIVPRRPVARQEPRDHGGPVVASERLQIVFLGLGWLHAGPRGQEREIAAALLERHAGAGAPVENAAGLAERESISDLGIQHRLDDLLAADRPGEALHPGTVFVVFLAPGSEVTLGSHHSRRDFAAYHNWFHHERGVVRYVVVPYDKDLDRCLGAARESLVQALINPEGNGWY